jgi:serine/threonine-protein kinase
MPLEPGTWLGSCEILAPLGAGGMGEVYRARDSVMKREVAIKVLPAELMRDPERSARLEREAHLIGQMSHPHIGVIYDLKRQGDLVYLVLELIPGLTLREKMQEGLLPPREALGIFRDIAKALEATHAKAIIHRDLKPENVKITPDGVVKVLDFGLAREVADYVGNSNETRTGPSQFTEAGTIVGTVSYMSPEQARGLSLDKRTDIWSFGVCLYEVLTGVLPFLGESAADVKANVLKEEPDFTLVRSRVPADIRKLIKRCLKKDLNQRLRDVGDARLELEAALEEPEDRAPAPLGGLTRRWAALMIGLAFLSGALATRLITLRAPESGDALRIFTLELPPTEPMALDAGPALAISSDGTGLVYTVPRGETTELHRRRRDELEPAKIPGTEGAQAPFLGTGSGELGFFSKGQLLRLSPNESSPDRLGESPSARGGSWLQDRIVFSPRTESGLSSTSSRGGSAESVTELAPGEKSHRWPSILPGGRVALFTCWTEKGFDVRLANLESGETKLVVENGTYARLARSGHLLFIRNFTLMAAEFDQTAGKIVGEPTAMVENVHFDPRTGAAFYDVSSEGTLVYAPYEEVVEGEAFGRLLFLDTDGNAAPISPLSRGYQVPRLSPSGGSVLTTITEGGSTDIWSMDLDRATLTRVTIDGQSSVGIWHPAGDRIAFAGYRNGVYNLFLKAVDSDAVEKRVTESANTQLPTSFSPDGSRLAYVELDPDTQFDIWVWDERTGRSEAVLHSPFMESAAVFSPDGQFLAYVSNETGEDEVYVVAADGSTAKTRISTTGGREPVFQGDGSALYYRTEDSLMRVDIQIQPAFRAGDPIPVFEAPFDEAGSPFANYDVTRDGSRFVMVRTDSGREAKRLIVITHWDSTLKERVPLRP